MVGVLYAVCCLSCGVCCVMRIVRCLIIMMYGRLFCSWRVMCGVCGVSYVVYRLWCIVCRLVCCVCVLSTGLMCGVC